MVLFLTIWAKMRLMAVKGNIYYFPILYSTGPSSTVCEAVQ